MRVRMYGIDAPEGNQTCQRDGVTENCGAHATSFLTQAIGGQLVSCALSGKDIYDRYLGVCSVGGVDLNAEMVRTGNAVAFVRYSYSYVLQELEARWEKRGIWGTSFLRPSDWRRRGS